MNTDEHDDLWHLLGKARMPAPSPFFSRNILRAIREEKQERRGALAWLRRHWQLAATGACAVLIAGFALNPAPDHPDNTTLLLAEQVSQSIDYQVIDNLDELIASEENLAWLEN